MSKIEKFWRDATADDVARVMAGETVEARFRNSKRHEWEQRVLRGWYRYGGDEKFWDQCGYQWLKCQVYREPSWYTNKPDPGPGWRLLGKFPDEEPQLGDSVFCPGSEIWLELEAGFDPGQRHGLWYRRRIEVVAKFAVGQTVRVVGPKVRPAKDWGKEMDRHVGLAGVIRSIPILEGEGTFYNLEGIGIWCFREDYLEPVEPVDSKPVLIRRRVVEIGDEFKLPNGRVWVFNGEGLEVKQ